MADRTITTVSRHRKISVDEAEAAYDILTAEVRANSSLDARYAFVFGVTDPEHPCDEYRFCGSLGFGGKFRNNGNRNGVPYVDCYPEDLTPERSAAINRANAKLAKLFAGPTP